jgi:hypothetical protein
MRLIEMPCAIFTIGRFSIWDWGHKDWHCDSCLEVSENRKEDRLRESIKDTVGQEAYEQGFKDGAETNPTQESRTR